MIDTHTHVYAKDFESDFDEVIRRAQKAGVKKMLLPNIDMESVEALHKMADEYPTFCFPMIGIHPTSVDASWKNDLSSVKKLLADNKDRYVAIGEIGMDLYWDKEHAVEQKLSFEEQLRWSAEYDLPVSIHSRNAVQEVVRSIKNVGAENLRGVFHSFGGDTDDLKKVMELKNFKIGVNGVVTFKNSAMPTVLKEMDLSDIILETDAPYLAPVPYRGKRNEPSYLPLIAAKLAEIYNTSIDQVIRITSENAADLFGLDNR